MTAVSLDTVSQFKGNGATQTSVSWSHTCSASANELLIGLVGVNVAANNGYASSVKYNNVACSSVTTITRTNSFQTLGVELWKLANPTSGANTISVTFNNGVRCVGFGTSFVNVSATSDVGAPATATGSSAAPSLVGVQANGTSDYLMGVIGCVDGGNGVSLSGPLLSAWTTTGGASTSAVGGIDTVAASATSSTLTAAVTASVQWGVIGIAALATVGGGGGGGGSTGTGSFFYFRRRRAA